MDANSTVGRLPAEAVPGTVEVIIEGARVLVLLAGEVDADLSADLADAADAVADAVLPVDIDVAGVTFMDSSGVAFLARVATSAAGPIRLLNPSESLRFLLEVTRIGELVEIVTL